MSDERKTSNWISHLRWTGGVLLGLAVVIQLYPVPHTNPPVKSSVVAPPDVESVLRRACFDCHSNETRWPWYSRVAPVSWWTVGHVTKARKDLNFSDWPTYDYGAQEEIFRDIRKEVESGAMPLPSYVLGHPEAKLSADDRALIITWAAPTDTGDDVDGD